MRFTAFQCVCLRIFRVAAQQPMKYNTAAHAHLHIPTHTYTYTCLRPASGRKYGYQKGTKPATKRNQTKRNGKRSDKHTFISNSLSLSVYAWFCVCVMYPGKPTIKYVIFHNLLPLQLNKKPNSPKSKRKQAKQASRTTVA